MLVVISIKPFLEALNIVFDAAINFMFDVMSINRRG